MNAYEAYERYLAFRQHFTTESYDLIRYNGKVRASPASFDKRKDKYFFHKLSKQPDVDKVLLSFFVEGGNTKAWVGDILAKKDTYLPLWTKRQESLTYIFTEDIKKMCGEIDTCFDACLHVFPDKSHPSLLTAYLQKKISIETIIILNDLLDFFPRWNTKIDEHVIWPRVRLLCQKYKPFVQYDKSKMKKIILDVANKS